jgi:hypothetical protein
VALPDCHHLINLLFDTGGSYGTPIVEVVEEEEELARLMENEIISVKILPEYEDLAIYLLSKNCQFQSLPDHIYMLRKSDLKFLEEAGLPYERIV